MRTMLLAFSMLFATHVLLAIDAPYMGSCNIPGAGLLACAYHTCSWDAVTGAVSYDWESYSDGWYGQSGCVAWYPGSNDICLVGNDTQENPEVTYFMDFGLGIQANTDSKMGRVRAAELVASRYWDPVLHQWRTIYVRIPGAWSNERWISVPYACRY